MRLFELEDLSWNTDHDKSENPHLRPRNADNEFEVLRVNIKDLFRNMDSSDDGVGFDLGKDGGGSNVKQHRVDRAIDHFKSKKPMDLPVVGWSDYDNNVFIENGRHRLYAAHKMGHEYAPAYVWRETLEAFAKHIRVKKV